MSDNGIAKPEDFKRVLERASIERVVLPESGLSVVLCRPPVFASLALGREGTRLQAKITDAEPEDIKEQDVEAFTRYLTETLTRLFVQPRFAATPEAGEIGLADILLEDLKFIFRWLRGEVLGAGNSERGTVNRGESVHYPPSTANCTQDLGRFPGGQGAASVPGGSGEAQPVPSERASGTHGDARVPPGLHRR